MLKSDHEPTRDESDKTPIRGQHSLHLVKFLIDRTKFFRQKGSHVRKGKDFGSFLHRHSLSKALHAPAPFFFFFFFFLPLLFFFLLLSFLLGFGRRPFKERKNRNEDTLSIENSHVDFVVVVLNREKSRQKIRGDIPPPSIQRREVGNGFISVRVTAGSMALGIILVDDKLHFSFQRHLVKQPRDVDVNGVSNPDFGVRGGVFGKSLDFRGTSVLLQHDSVFWVASTKSNHLILHIKLPKILWDLCNHLLLLGPENKACFDCGTGLLTDHFSKKLASLSRSKTQ
mmetsp:Transcript_36262/g.56820  ORF Transcript_36262/g.56820 Transcript_36262/m.56820 type:complete len:284 (+) Transcript_36262:1843-2694(+)